MEEIEDININTDNNINIREIELTGGPPWGFRIGAATTTTIQIQVHDDDDDYADEEEMRVVGAVKIARVSHLQLQFKSFFIIIALA
jgi:hypothetical protein